MKYRFLLGIAIILAGGHSFGATEGRSQSKACPSFEQYAAAPLADIDNDASLDDTVKTLFKIDRRLTRIDLEASFDCVLKRKRAFLKQAFGAQIVAVDDGLYQFPASDLAYGRVLVSKPAYQDFINGKLSQDAIIAKLNFDYELDGRVIDQALFVISNRSGRLEYSELKSGRFVKTSRCLKCHKPEKNTQVFFKHRYAGLKHNQKQPDLDLRRAP